MAGDGVLRDQDLIPSLLSQQLHVTCFNYAQSGFTQANELIVLMRLLTAGHRPDVVLFYDGGNEALYRVGFGQPHMAYTAYSRVPDLLNMRGMFARYLVGFVRRKSRILHTLLPDIDDPWLGAPHLTTETEVMRSRAQEVAEAFVEHAYFVKGLAEYYDFRLLIVVHPTLFTKRYLSDEEQALRVKIQTNAPSLEPIVTMTYDAIRARLPLPHVVDFSDAFGDSSHSVYVDFLHVSPRGNRMLATRLAEAIREAQEG